MISSRRRFNNFVHCFSMTIRKADLATRYVSRAFDSNDAAGIEIAKGQPGLVVQLQRTSDDPNRVEEPNWWIVDDFRFPSPVELRSERYRVGAKGWWRVVAFLEGDTTEFTSATYIALLAGELVDESNYYQQRRRNRTLLEATMQLDGGSYSLRRTLPHPIMDDSNSWPPVVFEDTGMLSARDLARNEFAAEIMNITGTMSATFREYRAGCLTSAVPTTHTVEAGQ